MPASDFTDKIWKIKSTIPGTQCEVGNLVEIKEGPGGLEIICGGRLLHGNAYHNPKFNRIEVGGEEIIRLQIEYIRPGFEIGGSWTAEDTASGMDDGGGEG
jgi:hypothetical protein